MMYVDEEEGIVYISPAELIFAWAPRNGDGVFLITPAEYFKKNRYLMDSELEVDNAIFYSLVEEVSDSYFEIIGSQDYKHVQKQFEKLGMTEEPGLLSLL